MPLVVLCAAWLAGIALQAGPAVPAAVPYACAVLAAAGALGANTRKFPGAWRPRWRLACAALCACALGAARYQAALPVIDENALAAYNDQGQAEVVGVVVDEPLVSDERQSLRVQAERVTAGRVRDRPVSGLVLVQAARYPVYAPGERLRVGGKLTTPPEAEDFSYKEYLARQGVYSLMQWPRIEQVGTAPLDPAGQVMAPLRAFRARAQATVNLIVPEPEASVLSGILLGLDDGIPRDLADAFSATGMTHIIAISGSNFVVLVGVAVALGKRALGAKWGAVAALIVVVVYTLLVGAGASVVRAAIMSGLAIIAQRLGRQAYALTSLACAAILMTLINPLTLWDAGFVLSAGATLGLVLYTEPLERLARRGLGRVLGAAWVERVLAVAGDAIIVTTAAQITTTPYIAYTFRRLSLVSLLVNFLVLPVQPPVMLWGGAGVLAGLLWAPAGQAVAAVAWLCLTYSCRIITALAAVPGAALVLDYVSPVPVWGYYALLFGITALPGAVKGRIGGFVRVHVRATTLLAFLLVLDLLLWSAIPALPDGRLHVTVLDVEDGSAALIETPRGLRILVDGGPRASTTLAQLGRRLPWWDRRIHLVISSHPKPARLSGLIAVVARYDVGHVITHGQDPDSPVYATWLETLAARGVPHQEAQEGMRLLTEDGVTITLLNVASDRRGSARLAAPAAGTQTNAEHAEPRRAVPIPPISVLLRGSASHFLAGATPDDESLVVHIAYGDVSFLLPSDITDQREAELARRVPPAAVLLAGRSGAADATSDAWLKAVSPSAVVFSVRPDPRTVLPAPEVLARTVFYPAWRTDEHGAVEFVTDGILLSVISER